MYQCVCKGKFPYKLLLIKWVSNFMQAQLNQNQDFVVLVLDSSRESVVGT